MLELRRSIEVSDHITTTATSTGSNTSYTTSTTARNQQQQQQVAEIERLTTEVQHLRQELDQLKRENYSLTDSHKSTKQHCDSLNKTITELKNTLYEKERIISDQLYNNKYNLPTSTSSSSYNTSLWNINENKLQYETQKTEIHELKQENMKLQKEIDQFIREVTKLNENILLKSQEIDHFKEKSKYSEENYYTIKIELTEKESEMRRLTHKLNETETAKVTYEEECARLTTALGIQQAEMEAYIRAHEATPRKVHFRTYSHSSSTTAATALSAGLFNSPDRTTTLRGSPHRTTTASLGDGIEVQSVSSSDESEDSGALHPGHLLTSTDTGIGRRKSSKHNSSCSEPMTSAVTNRDFYSNYTQPTQFPVTQLEIAAAEVIALVLMQEIDANMPKEEVSDRNNISRSTSNYARSTATTVNISKAAYLKDACIRAALRVVHTSTAMSRQTLQERNKEQQQLQQQDREHRQNTTSSSTTAVDRSGSENEGIDESKRSEHHHNNITTTSTTTPTKKKSLSPYKKPSNTHLGRVEIHPFHALGDRELLSRIVAEAHAGMAAIEDSDLVKQEIQHLEVRIYTVMLLLLLLLVVVYSHSFFNCIILCYGHYRQWCGSWKESA